MCFQPLGKQHAKRHKRLFPKQWANAPLFLLLLWGAIDFTAPVESKPPLKGSASFYGNTSKHYSSSQINGMRRNADQALAAYQLEAAKTQYQKILRHNPNSAAAWQGLGMVFFYETTASNQNVRNHIPELQAQAIQALMKASWLAPRNALSHVGLARVYMAQDRLQEAREQLQLAYQFNPKNPEVLTRYGEWLIHMQREQEAMPYLSQAIQLAPRHEAAHYFLGTAAQQLGEIDRAILAFQTTLGLNSNHAPAHFQLAQIYQAQGNGAAAVENYLQALSIKPEYTQARQALAQYLEANGDGEAALFHWKRLQSTEEPSWERTEHIAKLADQLGHPEVALAQYRAWQTQFPEDNTRYAPAISWAKTEIAKKGLQNAVANPQDPVKHNVEQALQYNPSNMEAQLINAKLDSAIGQLGKKKDSQTTAMIDVALQQVRLNPGQHFENGKMLLSRFQFQQAESVLREASRATEGLAAKRNLATIFLTLGLPDLAEESFNQLKQVVPDDYDVALGLTQAHDARTRSLMLMNEALPYERHNQLTLAYEKLTQALIANQKNALAHLHMGQVLEKQKQYARAADEYYAYLQLEPIGEKARHAKSRMDEMKRIMHRPHP